MSGRSRRGASAAVIAGALAALAAWAPSGVAAGDRAPVTIRLGEYFYRPAKVTVAPGQKVVFVNVGKISHTIADTTRNGTILSKLIKPHELKPGDRQVVTFKRRGIVYYLCTFHPTLMRGEIVVR